MDVEFKYEGTTSRRSKLDGQLFPSATDCLEQHVLTIDSNRHIDGVLMRSRVAVG